MNDVILLVVDDETIRLSLRDWLALVFDQCTIIGTPSGKAVTTARVRSPRVILIDVDVSPRQSAGLIRRLKAVGPSTEVVALTSDSHGALVDDIIGAGALACVRMTEIADQLPPLLRDLLRDERHRPRARDGMKTVVCIEDEPEMLQLIELILQRGPFRVFSAVSAERGLDLARMTKPDLVLLDLMMPDMDGWEVTRRMRVDNALKDIPIVVVSVVQPDRYPQRELEVDDYVTKPFRPEELLRRVSEMVQVVA